jgi:TetR/AcrR family transcriptional regulator, repressor for neighboring sulfatase
VAARRSAKGKSGKARRVRRSAEEAQRLILDAAEKRLREGGPEAIRLQDIARDVGISHPAILHHFASRVGLTEALEQRAMRRLEAELIESLSSQPAVGDSAVAAIERAFATLGDAGHARMLAWRVLQQGRPEPSAHQTLLRALADLVHARRVELAAAERRAAPSAQDTEFVVRLAAAAMLGDGIFAPFLDASFGRANDPARQRRFREWLARLLAEHTGAER